MPPVELIVGVGAVFFFFGLFILLLMRTRGEVIRLWIANTVSYYPRMKTHRPFRIKIKRGILQTLNPQIINVINHALFTYPKKDGKTEETCREGVPKDLAKKWKEIRENPAKHVIWTTFAKRRWRWRGQKGRWNFYYHFFAHDEMMLRFGRHRIWRVKLLPIPIGVHAPSKKEWLNMRFAEMSKTARKALSLSTSKSLNKEYDRDVKGHKWLLVMLHPTVTLTDEAQVMERLAGQEALLPIIAYAMRTLGTKLAKFDALMASVKGFRSFQRESKLVTEELIDDLGKSSSLIQNLQRSLKEKGIPTVVSPESSPMPFMPSAPSKQEPSTVKKALTGPFPWVQASVFIGFFFLVVGGLMYANDSNNWGLLFVGMFTFIFGVWMNWREKRLKGPSFERSTETIKEAVESLKEEGA